MCKNILNKFSLSLVIVLMCFSVSYAEWSGFDTIYAFPTTEMLFEDNICVWNDNIIFNSRDKIIMLGLDNNDELNTIDRLHLEDNCELMKLYGDILCIIAENKFSFVELTEDGFETIDSYIQPQIRDIALLNDRIFSINNMGSFFYELAVENNSVSRVDSFQVGGETLEIESGSSLLLVETYDYQGFQSCIYNISAQEPSIEYESGYYTYQNHYLINQDWIFYVNVDSQSESFAIQKINPFTGAISIEENFSGSLGSENTSVRLYNDKLAFFLNEYDGHYVQRSIVLNTADLSIIGNYELVDSEYPPVPFGGNKLFQVVTIQDPGTNRFIIKIFEMTTNTNADLITEYTPGNMILEDCYSDGDFFYIANNIMGLLVIQVTSEDEYTSYRIPGDGRTEEVSIYKYGDYLYTLCYDLYGGRPQSITIYNCSNPQEVERVGSFIPPTDYFTFKDMIKYNDFLVLSASLDNQNQIRVYSSDFETLYSTLRYEENMIESMALVDNYLYVKRHDSWQSWVEIFEINDSGVLELVNITFDITGSLDSVVGNQLYTIYGGHLYVYNVTDPLWPYFEKSFEQFSDGSTMWYKASYKEYAIGGQTNIGHNVIFDISGDEAVVLDDAPGLPSNDLRYLYGVSGGYLYVSEDIYDTEVPENSTSIPQSIHFDIYPNPANAAARISFNLDHSGEVGFALYNVLGQQVFWTSQVYPQGNHTYSLAGNMAALASGTYYLGVTVGGQETVKKLTVLK